MIDFEDRRFWVGLVLVLAALGMAYFVYQNYFWDECAGIEDPQLREECYTGKAVRNEDPSVCDRIEDLEGCDSCKNQVENAAGPAEIGGGGGSGDGGGGGSSTGFEIPEEGCDSLTGNERDWCYREMAVQESDPSLCLFIVDEYYKDSCYRYIAMTTGDSSYCDLMFSVKRKNWCHEAID